ncbi:MAG TPA: hypothetical protein VFD84_08945 [Candidatus Binatia bacterium]|jgi:hypothetical protein|nr:hypothetical protein [Candidatus Binatia bacterium]
MLPSFAGLIRTGEIAAGRIPHALAAQVPRTVLEAEAVWPAYAFDRNAGYTGTLPMGALLAIRPGVDVAAIGLPPTGQVIARAAQDYGVYTVERGGAGITFLAELNNPEIRWRSASGEDVWAEDVAIIARYLKRVTNNTEATPGGGGTPRVALAPPLDEPPPPPQLLSVTVVE